MNKPALENVKNLAFLSNESYKTAVMMWKIKIKKFLKNSL